MQEYYHHIPFFNEAPLFSFRRSTNLKDKLVQADFIPNSDNYEGKKDCFPCLSCDNCPLMIKGSVFAHLNTGVKFRIKNYLTCRNNLVIHVLQYPCPLLYVGETTNECRLRINSHRSTIRTKKVELPVPHHFMGKTQGV